MKWVICDSVREACGSVRLGGWERKKPKNDVVRAAVVWKVVRGARG